MDVTVVIPAFGGLEWDARADRAAASVPSGVPIIRCTGLDLAGARNSGLGAVETEWVCFLDADDELDRGYFDAMTTSGADLRAPAVQYVHRGRAARPYVPKVAGHRHACGAECLPFGNWLVIGTLARADLLRSVGGFRDFTWSEDWDLWVRCWQAGAAIEAVPDAIYRAHVRADSRNRAPARAAKLAAHQAIAQANGLPVPA